METCKTLPALGPARNRPALEQSSFHATHTTGTDCYERQLLSYEGKTRASQGKSGEMVSGSTHPVGLLKPWHSSCSSRRYGNTNGLLAHRCYSQCAMRPPCEENARLSSNARKSPLKQTTWPRRLKRSLLGKKDTGPAAVILADARAELRRAVTALDRHKQEHGCAWKPRSWQAALRASTDDWLMFPIIEY